MENKIEIKKFENKIETLKNEIENVEKEVADKLSINEIVVEARRTWDGLGISLSDKRTMWANDYVRIDINEDNFTISHGTGGWNKVTGEEQLMTMLDIADVLKYFNENKNYFYSKAKRINEIWDEVANTQKDLENAKVQEFKNNLLNEGFKTYDEVELKKILLDNLDKEIEVEIGNVYHQKVQKVKIKSTKINRRYKVIMNDNQIYALNEFVRFYNKDFIKGL